MRSEIPDIDANLQSREHSHRSRNYFVVGPLQSYSVSEFYVNKCLGTCYGISVPEPLGGGRFVIFRIGYLIQKKQVKKGKRNMYSYG